MIKRSRLEIIRDILKIIQENNNFIRITPLLRKSNLSSQRFYQYIEELIDKKFIIKIDKKIKLTSKGIDYLERYFNIIGFIEEFGL